MPNRAVRLDKVKRPGGVFQFDMELAAEDEAGTWLLYGTGRPWRAPHATGTMPIDALLLLRDDRPFVTWWVDDPDDRRIEIDVCLPPRLAADVWSFVDLELDPVRHELSGLVEVEDGDEFAEACQAGWITEEEATLARHTAEEMAEALRQRAEPWGEDGWRRLERHRSTIR